MSEVLILPEMLEAGIEAMKECRDAQRGDEATVIEIFLAMESTRELAIMRRDGAIH